MLPHHTRMAESAPPVSPSSGWRRWAGAMRELPLRLADRLSLQVAVVGAVVMGLLVPWGYLGYLEQQRAAREAVADLRLDTETVADVLAVAMREPLWQVSPDLAKSIAQAMLRDPRLVSIRVFGEDDTVYVDLYRSVNASAPNVMERRSIAFAGRDIGRLEVALSQSQMRESLQKQRVALITRLLVAFSLSLAMILLVLNRWVLHPLHRITLAAMSLGGRKPMPALAFSRHDELGQLALALDNAQGALRDAFDELERRNIELKAYASTLEERVAQRTSALTETNDRLTASLANLRRTQSTLLQSEKLASLGRLVAGIAHELNTPLGNAVTVTSAMDEAYRDFSGKVAVGGIKKSEFDAFMNHMADGVLILRRNVERAAGLIANFKQVAVDQSSERRRSFDLAEVVENVLLTLHPRFKRTPYLVQKELSDGVVLDSYPGPLEQVLTNLILNSLIHGFGERNYGTLTVRAEKLNAQRARLVVRDDGLGMSAEVKEKIFEPFFTTKFGQGGTGLGMNIVYSIVTGVLGGRIDVQSTEGEGSAVIIDLPLSAPEFKPDDTQTLQVPPDAVPGKS